MLCRLFRHRSKKGFQQCHFQKHLEKIGEAAAVSAVCALRAGCTLREVSYADIARLLSLSGCLDPANDMGLCRIWGGMDCVPESIPDSEEKLHTVLSSQNPGTAIYVLWQNPEKYGAMALLRKWLIDPDDTLRYHAAMAAGLLEMAECLPVLRELAEMAPFDLPHGYPYSCLKTRAIYRLGRMRDREALPILYRVAEEEVFPEQLEKIPHFARLAIARIEFGE